MRRKTILLAASGVCAVLAVLLAFFARDVGRWPQAIRSGDVAASDPARRAGVSWTVDERCRSRRPGRRSGWATTSRSAARRCASAAPTRATGAGTKQRGHPGPHPRRDGPRP